MFARVPASSNGRRGWLTTGSPQVMRPGLAGVRPGSPGDDPSRLGLRR